MGACVEPGSLIIVTELMRKGNLETLLRNQVTHLSLLTRLKMMKDTALAMNWYHIISLHIHVSKIKQTKYILGYINQNLRLFTGILNQVIY